MPLKPGEDTGKAIRDLHGGKTYSKTRKKHGKKKADKQAIAIALKNSRMRKGRKKHKRGAKRTHRK
jgi:hypothetical protein